MTVWKDKKTLPGILISGFIDFLIVMGTLMALLITIYGK